MKSRESCVRAFPIVFRVVGHVGGRHHSADGGGVAVAADHRTIVMGGALMSVLLISCFDMRLGLMLRLHRYTIQWRM